MSLTRFIKIFVGVFSFLSLLSLNCNAQNLEPPADRVILTISVAIDADQDSGSHTAKSPLQHQPALFDLKMLEAAGLTKIVTETPWTEGLIEFEGVLMRDLLERVKANGKLVHAVALDGYVVEIPMEDFLDYDVILATRINGKPMKVRENGPLWIIYPWTDSSALRRPHFYARSIWQLKSLTVIP